MDSACWKADEVWHHVPSTDRECANDSDCEVVNATCFLDTLNRTARANPRYAQIPCGDPASGACPTIVAHAVCRSGCCDAVH